MRSTAREHNVEYNNQCKVDPQFDPILVNEKPLETVPTAKLLGLNNSSDLRWNHHISEITRKVAARFCFMRQLKRANIPTKELLPTFYSTCIRPTLEYACPVFHNSLPKYLSEDLEQLQKWAQRIIYPFLSYLEVLRASGLPRLSVSDRREHLTRMLFVEVASNPSHKLHSLLPDSNSCQYNLRRQRKFASQGRILIVLRTHLLSAVVNIFNFFALFLQLVFDFLS